MARNDIVTEPSVERLLRLWGDERLDRYRHHVRIRNEIQKLNFVVMSLVKLDTHPVWEGRVRRENQETLDAEGFRRMFLSAVRKAGYPVKKDDLHVALKSRSVHFSLVLRDGIPGVMADLIKDGRRRWVFKPDWDSPLKLYFDAR